MRLEPLRNLSILQSLTLHSPFLKERLFGLSNPQGNHGESVKEAYFHLDNTPVRIFVVLIPGLCRFIFELCLLTVTLYHRLYVQTRTRCDYIFEKLTCQ